MERDLATLAKRSDEVIRDMQQGDNDLRTDLDNKMKTVETEITQTKGSVHQHVVDQPYIT